MGLKGNGGLRVQAAVRTFFDNSAVEKAIDKSNRDNLRTSGAAVRQEARKLIKPPKRATRKTFANLSREQRQRYHIKESVAKKRGEPKPKMPFVREPSAAGQPPRGRVGTLRNLMKFEGWQGGESVVIGPAKVNSKKANLKSLEEGGPTVTATGQKVTLEKHPFMGPSLSNRQPQISAIWKDSIKA